MLKNGNECELVAHTITYEMKNLSGRTSQSVWVDAIISGRRDGALGLYDIRTVSIPQEFVLDQTKFQWAGICANGVVFGDPQLAQTLLDRRAQMRRDIPDARKLLAELQRTNATPEAIRIALRHWQDEKSKASPLGPAENLWLRVAPNVLPLHLLSLIKGKQDSDAAEQMLRTLDGLETRLR